MVRIRLRQTTPFSLFWLMYTAARGHELHTASAQRRRRSGGAARTAEGRRSSGGKPRGSRPSDTLAAPVHSCRAYLPAVAARLPQGRAQCPSPEPWLVSGEPLGAADATPRLRGCGKSWHAARAALQICRHPPARRHLARRNQPLRGRRETPCENISKARSPGLKAIGVSLEAQSALSLCFMPAARRCACADRRRSWGWGPTPRVSAAAAWPRQQLLEFIQFQSLCPSLAC